MADLLRVHVAVEHPTMRQFLIDLLEDEYGCDVAGQAPGPEVACGDFGHGDLLVVDQRTFAAADWREAVARAGVRILVVAPEDDPSSREAAAAQGADAWLPREQIGELVGREILRALGHPPRVTTEGAT